MKKALSVSILLLLAVFLVACVIPEPLPLRPIATAPPSETERPPEATPDPEAGRIQPLPCGYDPVFGRMAPYEGSCVILDTLLLSVAESYTVEQAAAVINARPGWTVIEHWKAIHMVQGEYTPDNLTLAQLAAEKAALEALPQIAHAEFNMLVTVDTDD